MADYKAKQFLYLYLYVLESPRISADRAHVAVESGQIAVLSCTVTDSSQANVTWWKNNVQVLFV